MVNLTRLAWAIVPTLISLVLLDDAEAPARLPTAPLPASGSGLRVFPVAASGHPSFASTFADPRVGHSHQGNDIFAPEGTPVLAVDDGSTRHDLDPLGGTVLYLAGSDGTRYYYAHLQGYEGEARTVRAGEVIARVGKTGNAANTSPHLHFEMHPGGGPAIDPFPALSAVAPPGAVRAVA